MGGSWCQLLGVPSTREQTRSRGAAGDRWWGSLLVFLPACPDIQSWDESGLRGCAHSWANPRLHRSCSYTQTGRAWPSSGPIQLCYLIVPPVGFVAHGCGFSVSLVLTVSGLPFLTPSFCFFPVLLLVPHQLVSGFRLALVASVDWLTSVMRLFS